MKAKSEVRPDDELNDGYVYEVKITIDVRRLDKQPLNDHENAMVQIMQAAAQEEVAKVMAEHGQPRKKDLGTFLRSY